MALPSDLSKYDFTAEDINRGSMAKDTTYYNDWINISENSAIIDISVESPFTNPLTVNNAANKLLGKSTTDNLPSDIERNVFKQMNANNGTNFTNKGQFLLYVYDINDAIAAAKKEVPIDENKIKLLEKAMENAMAGIKFYNRTLEALNNYKTTWNNDLLFAKQETAKTELNIEELPSGEVEDAPIDVSVEVPTKEEETPKVDAKINEKMMYKTWDPRLYRLDTFLMKTEDDPNGIRVPFATSTVASAFADLNFVVEKAFVKKLIESGKHTSVDKYFPDSNSLNAYKPTNLSSAGGSSTADANTNNQLESLDDTEKLIVNDTTQFENDPGNFGVQSIVHPYSLTKLVGGLDSISKSGAENFMFDIRDKRRYYGLSVNSDDVLAVSNPTISLLIQWSNADKWGRTPYSWQDFVYCKYLGQIKTNRLITLRRYNAPTYDNLQFESMYGEIENKETKSINPEDRENSANKIFSPHATVVTYFGGDTGNTLAGLMNFSTGIKWKDIEAKIHEVSGDEGSDPLALIDEMADGKSNLYGQADAEGIINKSLESMSVVSSKIMSYGKFALALNKPIGMEEELQSKYFSAATDPYSSLFVNRILGPINAIKSVKARDQGIEFSLNLSIKCSYVARSIGGINPKAALLDVLGNCMEMVSPTAVFWGGGFRFMVTPHAYPYHDGGWRDNFMKKIYDGKFLGNEGAIATALSGIKKLGQNGDGSDTFSWDTFSANLGGIASEAMSMMGSAVQSISNMFGGSNFLNAIADGAQGLATAGKSEEEAAAIQNSASLKVSNFANNLQTMWRNKVLMRSTLPSIKTSGTLLIGEPVGEWHLTIGNPLNPQMVIGNLICEKMEVEWDEELGPDDFPIGFSVKYTLLHGMQRDKDAILSMLNRGMGKYYCLPDWMHCSSDLTTYVDAFTKNAGTGDTGEIGYRSADWMKEQMTAAGYSTSGFNVRQIQGGTKLLSHANPNTQIITKFNPINSNATRTVGEILTSKFVESNFAIIKSLASTRKIIS